MGSKRNSKSTVATDFAKFLYTYSDTYSDTYTYTYTDSDSDSNSNANANANADSNANPDTYSHSDPDTLTPPLELRLAAGSDSRRQYNHLWAGRRNEGVTQISAQRRLPIGAELLAPGPGSLPGLGSENANPRRLSSHRK